ATPPPGWTIGDPDAKPKDGFLIGDVSEPDQPQLLGQWVSGGTGTHRNFYNGGQWVYAASNLPGFEGQVLAIVDIADPANPKTAGIWWHPGQNKAAGETYTHEDERRLTPGPPHPQARPAAGPVPPRRRLRPWRSCVLPLDARRDGHPRRRRQAPPETRPPAAGLPAAWQHHRRALGGATAGPRRRSHQQRGAARGVQRTRLLRRDGRRLR